MKPAGFAYSAPTTVDEVIQRLTEYGDGAKLLAGGQSLVPLLNFRLAQPSYLIDLNRVAELVGVEVNGQVQIGSMTRQRDVMESEEIGRVAPLVRQAISHIGHPAIRTRGTVGGSVAHNDPAAELPAALLALDATISVRGPAGERQLPIDEFLGEWLSTALAVDEVITTISFTAADSATRTGIREFAKRHGDFALAGVVVRLTMSESGVVTDARVVGFGGLARATRFPLAEVALIGGTPTPDAFAAAANAVREAAAPVGDLHASADYRNHLLGVYTVRALEAATAAEG